MHNKIVRKARRTVAVNRAMCTNEQTMNTQIRFLRFSRRTQVVDRCVARHDGGWLVRLSDGRAGVSPCPLEPGVRAVLGDDGRVERGR